MSSNESTIKNLQAELRRRSQELRDCQKKSEEAREYLSTHLKIRDRDFADLEEQNRELRERVADLEARSGGS